MSSLRPLLDVSYNRPKFAACATWNQNAVTFAENNTIGQTAAGIFVNTNNTVYATTLSASSVLIWPEGSAYPTGSINGDLNSSHGVFVTTSGDIYADNGAYKMRVDVWTMNAANSTPGLYVHEMCGGLFVDVYDSLYCALTYSHRVLKKTLASNPNTSVLVAGTGTNGSTLDMLTLPYGIFVVIDLSLFVADYGNDRIQLFQSSQSDGTTVAGNGAPNTISLSRPTGVIVDADGYLFIADQLNHRIVGSGPSGFRCIAACTGTNGAAANQFHYPYDLGFDSHGNLYVTDAGNSRIQKFTLARNICGKSPKTVCFVSMTTLASPVYERFLVIIPYIVFEMHCNFS